MSILSDRDIIRLVDEGSLIITPFNESMIQEASLNIRLGKNIRKLLHKKIEVNEEMLDLNDISEPIQGDKIVFRPGETIIAESYEEIDLPLNIVGLIMSRLAFSSLGIQTQGVIQPGSRGRQRLVINNHGPIEIDIGPNDCICQIIFFETIDYAEKGYGELKSAFLRQISFMEPQIEQIYLIYRDGRLIAPYQTTKLTDRDGIVIAGMLEAIEIYVKDSFSSEKSEWAIELIEFLNIDPEMQSESYRKSYLLVARGDFLSIAIIFYGPKRERLMLRMKEWITSIEQENGGLLSAWDGVLEKMEPIRKKMDNFVSSLRS